MATETMTEKETRSTSQVTIRNEEEEQPPLPTLREEEEEEGLHYSDESDETTRRRQTSWSQEVQSGPPYPTYATPPAGPYGEGWYNRGETQSPSPPGAYLPRTLGDPSAVSRRDSLNVFRGSFQPSLFTPQPRRLDPYGVATTHDPRTQAFSQAPRTPDPGGERRGRSLSPKRTRASPSQGGGRKKRVSPSRGGGGGGGSPPRPPTPIPPPRRTSPPRRRAPARGGGGGGPPGPPGGGGGVPVPPPRIMGAGAAPPPMRIPKMEQPDPFDGSAENWNKFIQQLAIWTEGYSDFFRNQRQRCVYFLYFCKGEKINGWVSSIFRTRGMPNESQYLSDFEALVTRAAEMWGPVNVKEEAQRTLDEFKQGPQTVAEYHSKFVGNAPLTEYDEEVLNHIFLKGLNWNIQNLFINVAKTTRVRETFTIALEFESRLKERAINFKRNEASTNKKQGTGNTTKEKIKAGRLTEEQRKEYMKEGKCFRCSKKDHVAKNCPEKSQKIKSVTEQEREEEEETKSTKEENFTQA